MNILKQFAEKHNAWVSAPLVDARLTEYEHVARALKAYCEHQLGEVDSLGRALTELRDEERELAVLFRIPLSPKDLAAGEREEELEGDSLQLVTKRLLRPPSASLRTAATICDEALRSLGATIKNWDEFVLRCKAIESAREDTRRSFLRAVSLYEEARAEYESFARNPEKMTVQNEEAKAAFMNQLSLNVRHRQLAIRDAAKERHVALHSLDHAPETDLRQCIDELRSDWRHVCEALGQLLEYLRSTRDHENDRALRGRLYSVIVFLAQDVFLTLHANFDRARLPGVKLPT